MGRGCAGRMKYYVAADVHGFFTQMAAALEEAGYFVDTVPHKLVLLGDLFDRCRRQMNCKSFFWTL